MSRIRQLKPEFFLDEDLAATCCRDARLLFEGLWVLADRCGILEDRPAMIKALIFPYDDDITAKTISELLQMLGRGGFIVQYIQKSKKLVWVRNFEKHQHIHPNESKSLYLIPSKGDMILSGNYRDAQEIPHTSTSTSTSTDTSALCAGHTSAGAKGRRPSKKTGAPDEFEISESLKEWASKACPKIDLKEETENFLIHHRARGNSFSNWDSAWQGWMKKAVKFAARDAANGNGKSYKPDTIGQDLEGAALPAAELAEKRRKQTEEMLGVTE